MGFRFRKSIKAGPLRINLSKSGVGYSIGGKGFRYTKKAGGGTRTTVSIPGTGISHVSETGKKSSRTNKHPISPVKKEGNKMSKPKNKNTEFILCLLLGWAGGHKFYMRKPGMGILYLLTMGLFTIGWFGDAIKLGMAKFSKNPDESPKGIKKVAPYLIAFLCATVLGSCGGGDTETPLPTDPTTPTELVTEYVEETAEAPTEIETEAPTDAPTEATEPPTTEPPATVPPTEAPTAAPTEAPTEAPTAAPTQAPTEPPTEAPQAQKQTYVLNTNPSSLRFHYPSCRDVAKMKDSNKKIFEGTREEVRAMGYIPCGHCNP